MPRVLHNISRGLVGQVIVQHPVVHALVIAERTLEDLRSRHGKLRAARRGNRLRHLGISKQLLPRCGVVSLAGVAGLGRVAEWLHFRRTAGRGLAAQIDEALLLDEGALEGAHGVEVHIIRGIDVPAVVVRVHEDDRGGEVMVVIDDELEVGQGLATLVLGGVGGRGGVVDGVDEVAPTKLGH